MKALPSVPFIGIFVFILATVGLFQRIAWTQTPTATPPCRPGMGDFMTASVQPRHIKLAAAGYVGNWAMIFGGTNAKLYNYDISKRTDIGPNRDRFARMKDEYERQGPARSNLRYGYVRGPVDWSAFA